MMNEKHKTDFKIILKVVYRVDSIIRFFEAGFSRIFIAYEILVRNFLYRIIFWTKVAIRRRVKLSN